MRYVTYNSKYRDIVTGASFCYCNDLIVHVHICCYIELRDDVGEDIFAMAQHRYYSTHRESSSLII